MKKTRTSKNRLVRRIAFGSVLLAAVAAAVQAAPAPFTVEEAGIAEIHAAMTKGDLTASQLLSRYLARIDAYDQRGPKLNSIILLNPQAAAQAEALDAEFARTKRLRPLHGIPVLLKDNVETEGLQTTAGSLSLKGYVPAQDAFLTKKLREAGAIVIAKTNLHEFAVWGETVSSIGRPDAQSVRPRRARPAARAAAPGPAWRRTSARSASAPTPSTRSVRRHRRTAWSGCGRRSAWSAARASCRTR